MSTDEIRKRVFLRAPRSRVWEALIDSKKFGTWFGCAFEGPFEVGARLHARVVPTAVDSEVARVQAACETEAFDILVDRIEPMTRFSFRWHPGAEVPEPPFPDAEMTTVTFELADAEGGVLLTITESGFDRVPLERRAKVFETNEGGWAAQAELIEKFLRDAT